MSENKTPVEPIEPPAPPVDPAPIEPEPTPVDLDPREQEKADAADIAAVESAKKAYVAAQAEVAWLDKQRPKLKIEFEKRVTKAMGDFKETYDEAREEKRVAYQYLQQAEQKAAAALERKRIADVAAAENATRERRTKENEARKRAQAEDLAKYIREAAGK